ncbi:cytochrome P450 714C2-like [Eucalyptus grandis]|uniref:cytochrome P450 714C2-like n=1 Tax=Eucalyptus grandis TaxID=71139 RepID=UPI00192EF82A|nr:cytochrome P450 714C2-like [Eucalyptus grandis]
MAIECLCDFGAAREFCECQSAEFGRSAYLRKNRGNGGHESVISMLEKWDSQMEEARGVASDLLSKQQAIVGLPAVRHIPTKITCDIWRIGKEVDRSILKLMDDDCNAKGQSFSQDLVNNFDRGSSVIVDNCKAMFMAGRETTATAPTFALVLLSHHLEWREHVHAQLNMVIYETLHLYSPGPFVTRKTSEEMKFGDFVIPRGVNLWLSSSLLHQDPANQGNNAHEFHPEGFANGISSACKNPNLFMPFGMGMRTCIGQNFVMTELKMASYYLQFCMSCCLLFIMNVMDKAMYKIQQRSPNSVAFLGKKDNETDGHIHSIKNKYTNADMHNRLVDALERCIVMEKLLSVFRSYQ